MLSRGVSPLMANRQTRDDHVAGQTALPTSGGSPHLRQAGGSGVGEAEIWQREEDEADLLRIQPAAGLQKPFFQAKIADEDHPSSLHPTGLP